MFMKMSITSAVLMLFFTTSLLSVTLFEIKDESGNPVLVVTSDGLRILNGADTLMVISTNEIKAFVDEGSKGLSRSFSVTTSSTKKAPGKKVMDVQPGDGGMKVYNLGDTLMTISSKSISANIGSSKGLSRSFSVTTSSTKGDPIKVFDVTTSNSTMREGVGGDEYTNFTPDNIFLGLHAGETTVTGLGNAFIGNNAGMSNIIGHDNVMMGESAGKNFIGSFGNVFIGQESAKNLVKGHRNVMIGYKAGSDPISTDSLYGNVFLGAVAGKKVTGSYNVMIGESAGDNWDLGSNGMNNVFIGKEAGQYNTGSFNICIGDGTGSRAQTDPNTGSHNIFIGEGADATLKTESYRLAIGGDYGDLLYGRLNTPKQLVINGNLDDNLSGYTFYVNGEAGGDYAWNNLSDERMKKNIRTINDALDKVMKLRGVTYEWKDENSLEKGRRMGFIAQESIDVIPEVVNFNKENDIYSMQYANITAILVEAIKELKKEVNSSVAALETKDTENKKIIDGQNEKIGMLINENKELKSKVQELESLRAEIDLIKRQIAGYTSR